MVMPLLCCVGRNLVVVDLLLMKDIVIHHGTVALILMYCLAFASNLYVIASYRSIL